MTLGPAVAFGLAGVLGSAGALEPVVALGFATTFGPLITLDE